MAGGIPSRSVGQRLTCRMWPTSNALLPHIQPPNANGRARRRLVAISARAGHPRPLTPTWKGSSLLLLTGQPGPAPANETSSHNLASPPLVGRQPKQRGSYCADPATRIIGRPLPCPPKQLPRAAPMPPVRPSPSALAVRSFVRQAAIPRQPRRPDKELAMSSAPLRASEPTRVFDVADD